MDELKKKITLLNSKPGENRAEVIEEDRETQSEDARHAMALINSAGDVFKPIGSKHLGTAVIHYYSMGEDGLEPKYFVVCQTSVGNVTEHHADLGWKQLRSSLMKAYGRSEPKTRD